MAKWKQSPKWPKTYMPTHIYTRTHFPINCLNKSHTHIKHSTWRICLGICHYFWIRLHCFLTFLCLMMCLFVCVIISPARRHARRSDSNWKSTWKGNEVHGNIDTCMNMPKKHARTHKISAFNTKCIFFLVIRINWTPRNYESLTLVATINKHNVFKHGSSKTLFPMNESHAWISML